MKSNRVPIVFFARPFETWVTVACMISGVPSATGAPRPTSIDASMPKWVAIVWGITLVVGSFLAALGLLSGGNEVKPGCSYIIERLGFRMLGVAAVIYAISILGYLQIRGFVSGMMIIGFGLACLARVYWLGVLLRTGDRRRG